MLVNSRILLNAEKDLFIMKIIANDYDPKTIMKIIREWSEKDQSSFGEELGLSKMTIQGYERGVRRYTFETLLEIANEYGLKITIEKK